MSCKSADFEQRRGGLMEYRLYNYQLSRNVGAESLVLLTILVQTSATLCESAICFPSSCVHRLILSPVRAITPPFGAYTAHEGR